MTLSRFEEFMVEVAVLAEKEFESAILNKKTSDIFEDRECLEAYYKISLCEELGVVYRQKVIHKERHILDKMLDLLDGWECRGFYGYQLYSLKPWYLYGHKVVESSARLWVARWLLSRIKGAA